MLNNYIYFFITSLIILLFPSVVLQLFAPFLVFIFYRSSKMEALWWSVACGLVLDLLSPHTTLGLFAFTYAVTTALLYDRKQHFFIDNLSTLPLMTFMFSVLSTLILALLVQIPISLPWIATDLLLMPLGDAFIAFFCYTVPYWQLAPKRRRGEEYFL